MFKFWENLMMTHPAVTKVIFTGLSINFAFILFIIASKLGVIKSLRAGKDGVSIEGVDKKETEKRFESGNLHNLMNQQIKKADMEMMDYALDKSTNIRRGLSKSLSVASYCVSSRQALIACLRYPLYETAHRNNFKYVLRPENIKFYIERLMRELSFEYDELAGGIETSICPNNTNHNCKALPAFSEVYENIREQLINNWVLPLRHEQVRTHYKKIEIYKQYVTLFDQLGDIVMKRVCSDCIDKNKRYVEALNRRPEINEL